MNITSILNSSVCSRLKLFLALSRTPHGLLDLGTPALGAILWLGTLPPARVIALGLVTAFAGYTAVYALNDLVDYRGDREKIHQRDPDDWGGDLDAVFVPHPIARGLLSFKAGLWWSVIWGLVALAGAYQLSPVCALIFIVSCILEAVYCLLLEVNHLRTLVSGAVKTSGGIAAVFAVDPDPSPLFLVVLFLWLFFWEIGGQNVPNDWYDTEEDRRLRAKTVPVRYGLRGASVIILGSLTLSLALNLLLFQLAPAKLPLPFSALSLVAGLYLLLVPALRLYRTKIRQQALVLFNKASYYPLAVLVIVLIGLMT
jgi:4-hydroxybenzoate polyprenyltransferase